MTATETPSAGTETDAFAERFLSSTLGLVDVLSIHLGDRLGWYRALADAGDAGLDSSRLASATGTQERYAREWLEQQAVSGILRVVNGRDATSRSFQLPPGPKEVLTDTSSLSYLAPIARIFAASAMHLPQLLQAYRAGGGVSWAELGDEARESQADANRPLFEQRLAPALEATEVHGLLSKPGARILDVGCGLGWSTIALARAYPEAALVGMDIDRPSIGRAQLNAIDAGLGDRIEFRAGDATMLGVPGALAAQAGEEGELDAAGVETDGGFDAAFIFEALHDMPYPAQVLRSVRSALAESGVLVVIDEAVADAFAPNGDEVERLMYGYSLLVCLPDSLSSPESVGTGTVMRRATLERYAHEAGFSAVEVLPIESFGFFRCYLLRP